MYHDILNLVISHISQSTEPVLQSQLTKVIKDGYGERGAELFRYVLYYADYRDELKRIKKGRSYQLLLPHQLPKDTSTEMLTPPKKAQRKRATTSITVPKTPRVRNVSTKPTSFIKEIKRGYRKGQKQANETSEILIGFVVIIGFFIWLFS